MDRKKKLIDHFLSATGIQINGPNPWDIQVKDERLQVYRSTAPIHGIFR